MGGDEDHDLGLADEGHRLVHGAGGGGGVPPGERRVCRVSNLT